MEELTLSIPNKKDAQYKIYIGHQILQKLSELIDESQYTKIIVLSDYSVAEHYIETVKSSFKDHIHQILIPPGEVAKNFMSLDYIWGQLHEYGADRHSLLINLGGGVITDIGGFAASTYMRGMPFIQIPTTLLSQVDASVGGKTGINFSGVKNLLGTFTQPESVIIDVDTLKTLPKREKIGGFAEILKHGFIADSKYLEICTQKKPEDFLQDELIEIIKGSCVIKSEVVAQDEKESGLRKILNFGHTIGHVLESQSHEDTTVFPDGPIHHGEAVALGMIVEARISNAIGSLTEESLQKIETIIKESGLPTEVPHIDIAIILEKIKTDKKNVGDDVKWTLLSDIGSCVFDQSVPEEILRKIV